jgi:hypothetical protein
MARLHVSGCYPLGCRVQQIAVGPQLGAMARWLHHRGQVIGWDLTWLQVRMDHWGIFVVLRAHLIRALTPQGGWR